jgi:HK97 family phage portal protein
MGLISSIEHRARVTPGASVATGGGWLGELFSGGQTLAGVKITNESALSYPPFLSTCLTISEPAGTLPLKLYRWRDSGREEVREDPRWGLVHDEPNPEMSAASWRTTLMLQALTGGNHYAELVRDGAGRVREIWPIDPDHVALKRTEDESRRLYYEVSSAAGTPKRLEPANMLHILGPSLDALTGMSPVQLSKESLALGMASVLFSAAFLGNGSWFGGFLEHPGKLSADARKNLKGSIESKHQGVLKAGALKILEEGMKYSPAGVPPEQAQLIETRKEQRSETAAIHRVPPHMIGDVSGSTSWGTGIEQQTIGFITYALRSWLVRIEQELNRKLLSSAERSKLYFEHSLDALLRGDIKTRTDSAVMLRNVGLLSYNDWARQENKPTDGTDYGDAYFMPLNMVPADLAMEPEPTPEPVSAPDPADPPADPAEPSRSARIDEMARRIERSFLPLFHRELARLAKKEAALVTGVAEQDRKAYLVAVFGVLQRHAGYFETVLGPAVRSLVEAVGSQACAYLGIDETEPLRELELEAAAAVRAMAETHMLESRFGVEQDGAAAVDGWQARAADEARRLVSSASQSALTLVSRQIAR